MAVANAPSGNLPTSARAPRYRNWFGTLFFNDEMNGEANDAVFATWGEQCLTDFWATGKMRFCVGQIERCPDTGRIHLQFMCSLKNPSGLQAVKRVLKSDTVHLEVVKDLLRSINYCSKEDTRVCGPWQHGTYTLRANIE